jgi:hypothetical protein
LSEKGNAAKVEDALRERGTGKMVGLELGEIPRPWLR